MATGATEHRRHGRIPRSSFVQKAAAALAPKRRQQSATLQSASNTIPEGHVMTHEQRGNNHSPIAAHRQDHHNAFDIFRVRACLRRRRNTSGGVAKTAYTASEIEHRAVQQNLPLTPAADTKRRWRGVQPRHPFFAGSATPFRDTVVTFLCENNELNRWRGCRPATRRKADGKLDVTSEHIGDASRPRSSKR